MAAFFCLLAFVCTIANAAPPTSPRLYQQHAQAQLQQVNPLDYYLDNSDVANYYNQPQQKQGAVNQEQSGTPMRLENLDPNTEVELLPGAQQPVQPPQQVPNIPGLLPGQRVFIVHMPVPGYRPGTIGGYQPVYIVAAAPQGNQGFPGNGINGYQNAVLLPRPAVISPLLDYSRIAGVQNANPALLPAAPLTLNRPYDLIYPDPSAAYQPAQGQNSADGTTGSVRLSQLIALQGQQHPHSNNHRTTGNETPTKSESRNNSSGDSIESKDEESTGNARPAPPHSQKKP